MKWDGKAPEDVGHVRVTKWRDSVTRPFTAQAMVCRGWTRDALRAPAVRTIHVELLASESAIEALSRLLRDIGQWLESGSPEPPRGYRRLSAARTRGLTVC